MAELLHEQEKLKPFAQVLPHCSKLLAAEISRLQKLTSVQDMHEITPNRKIKRVGKLYVPVLEYPNVSAIFCFLNIEKVQFYWTYFGTTWVIFTRNRKANQL